MELNNGHRKFVFNYLRKLGCSREVAEDITQEVLLKAWRSYSSSVANETAWMVGLARNTMITHWRKTVTMRRTGAIKKEVYIPEYEELLGSYELSDGPVQLKELENYISQVQKPLYRHLLELFLEGYELQEMGEMLGMSTANVKTKVHRAKLALLEVANEAQARSSPASCGCQ